MYLTWRDVAAQLRAASEERDWSAAVTAGGVRVDPGRLNGEDALNDVLTALECTEPVHVALGGDLRVTVDKVRRGATDRRLRWAPTAPEVIARTKLDGLAVPVHVVHGDDRAPVLSVVTTLLATAPKRWLLVDAGTHCPATRVAGEVAWADVVGALFDGVAVDEVVRTTAALVNREEICTLPAVRVADQLISKVPTLAELTGRRGPGCPAEVIARLAEAVGKDRALVVLPPGRTPDSVLMIDPRLHRHLVSLDETIAQAELRLLTVTKDSPPVITYDGSLEPREVALKLTGEVRS